MHTLTATSSHSSTVVGAPLGAHPSCRRCTAPAFCALHCSWHAADAPTSEEVPQEVSPHPKVRSLHTASTLPAHCWVPAVLLNLGRFRGASGVLSVGTEPLRWLLLISLNFFTIWWHACLNSLQVIPSLLFNSADGCFKLPLSSSQYYQFLVKKSFIIDRFGYSIHIDCLHLVSIMISVVFTWTTLPRGGSADSSTVYM